MKNDAKIRRDRYRSVEHTKKKGPKKHKKAHVKAFARYSFALRCRCGENIKTSHLHTSEKEREHKIKWQRRKGCAGNATDSRDARYNSRSK